MAPFMERNVWSSTSIIFSDIVYVPMNKHGKYEHAGINTFGVMGLRSLKNKCENWKFWLFEQSTEGICFYVEH